MEGQNWTKIVTNSLIGALLFFAIWDSATIISAGHRGVVTRIGRVTGRILTEGLHFTLPFVEKTWVAEVRIQKEQIDAAAASQDLQEVKSTIALNYHLDPVAVQTIYQSLGPDFKERIIDPSIQESFKAVTARFPVADLLTKRAEVKLQARQILEERLHKNNILVDDLSIVNFDFSKEFNQAIEQKQVSQQEAERAAYKLEASRKEAQAIQVQAEAISANPAIVQYEAVKKWDGKLPNVTGSAIPFISVDKGTNAQGLSRVEDGGGKK